jgi:hypothetical protein
MSQWGDEQKRQAAGGVVTDERKYTLSEARQELARRECVEHGHDWHVVLMLGTNVPYSVACDRCGQIHVVVS